MLDLMLKARDEYNVRLKLMNIQTKGRDCAYLVLSCTLPSFKSGQRIETNVWYYGNSNMVSILHQAPSLQPNPIHPRPIPRLRC